MSNQEMKKAILECDTHRLEDSVMQQMIKYMPTPEQVKKLSDLPLSEQVDLIDAEKFALEVH